MVSVQEQSGELNDEVGVRARVCVEVGLRGSKFNNNPVTFGPRLSDTCQSISAHLKARPQSAPHCSDARRCPCVLFSREEVVCDVCADRACSTLATVTEAPLWDVHGLVVDAAEHQRSTAVCAMWAAVDIH